MAGKVTETVKSAVGCLTAAAAILVVLIIGFALLHVILYLLPAVIAVVIILGALYGIFYVIKALLTGK